jgi:FkbM family methyltransferase
MQYADAFVDIGANIGYFTFFIRANTDVKKPIYFFEPDPDLFNLIDTNVLSNALQNVHGFKTAIGSIVGKLTFYQNISDYLSGSITQDFSAKHDLNQIIVDSTTFSEFASKIELKNACVKVDVEGAEFDFIKGAMDSLDSISYLIMEVLGSAVENKLIERIIDLGYFAYYINDYRLEYSVDGSFNYQSSQYNWLFCHDSPDRLREKLIDSKFQVME